MCLVISLRAGFLRFLPISCSFTTRVTASSFSSESHRGEKRAARLFSGSHRNSDIDRVLLHFAAGSPETVEQIDMGLSFSGWSRYLFPGLFRLSAADVHGGSFTAAGIGRDVSGS